MLISLEINKARVMYMNIKLYVFFKKICNMVITRYAYEY